MIKLPAIIKKIGTLADKTLRVTVDTNEANPDQMAELFTHLDKFGWFVFAENVAVEDVPTENAPEFEGDKSLSQRFRDVLYVYWQQKVKPKSNKTFVQFRSEYMERKIQEVKDNLD